jgi:hypothetical protein
VLHHPWIIKVIVVLVAAAAAAAAVRWQLLLLTLTRCSREAEKFGHAFCRPKTKNNCGGKG